jgi:hypothetical protein
MNLIALLGPLRCIKELNRPARAASPITKLRNQEKTVRYIICASGIKNQSELDTHNVT